MKKTLAILLSSFILNSCETPKAVEQWPADIGAIMNLNKGPDYDGKLQSLVKKQL